MKKLIAVAALMVSTSAVAKDQVVVVEPASHPDWSKVRMSAEDILVAQLVDPESARIKWTKGFQWTSWKQGSMGFANKRRWGWLACGTLNAKNRMGGYAGAEKVIIAVAEDGTMKAGPSHNIDSDCSWDSGRFGEIVAELQPRVEG